MNECIEVVRLGFGMPAFNNDEIIIPSFIEKGVKEEDAYNYSAIGSAGEMGIPLHRNEFPEFPQIPADSNE